MAGLLKKTHRRLKMYALDAFDAVTGGRKPLVPPRSLDHNHTFVGGDEIAALIESYTGLKANSHILDIGCGLGRIAASLTKKLDSQGRYVGIDIVPGAIDWLNREYSSRYPNFRFYHLDVHSSAYNPRGRMSADAVNFDVLGEQTFDVIYLVSVFTHMYPKHIRHYLRLIARHLKPTGILFASVFINDDFARAQQARTDADGKTLARRFTFKGEGFYAPKAGNPEMAAAYDPDQIEDLFDGSGLAVEQPFRYGSWCARPNGHSFYQDVLIARKAEPSLSRQAAG